MLQQDEPEDYVIATGIERSVREFVNADANELGISLQWQGEGMQETANVVAVDRHHYLKQGQVIVRVDPSYVSDDECHSMLGDASKAHIKLHWRANTSFEELVRDMVREDLDECQQSLAATSFNIDSNVHHGGYWQH